MSKPVAWLAYAPDASESSFVTQFQEQAEAAARDWGWSVEPLYAKPSSQWISVSERLPDERVDVLVSAAYDRDLPYCYDAMHVCQRFEGDWVEATEYNRIEGVTHWMPLPEPPEVK